MSDSTLDKMKGQCLELLLEIFPAEHILATMVFALVFNQLAHDLSLSVYDALLHLNFDNSVGLKSGKFWGVPLAIFGVAFLAVAINVFIMGVGLRFSFRRSGVDAKIVEWMRKANSAIKSLEQGGREAVHSSIEKEFNKRLKRYRAKRMLSEVALSILGLVLWGSILLLWTSKGQLEISRPDCLIALGAGVGGFLLHRESIRYAISSLIPLQIYACAASGEIAFFEGME
ncbi:hypothetical protein [Ralstonia pseudosolanacearum]|uniref:hypothetical protein n=1 Tax=Ralstonia pseudosolanacearum TaxID=1310165 RepID=UPI001FFB1B55|nr:hypothetical protein [Ralstonia pseudosolanacearum]